MDHEKLQVIKDLMDELVGDMEPGADDFDMRLGKPKMDVMALKAGSGGDDDDDAMDGDMGAMDGDFMDPEEKFKQRLMKLKG